MIHNSKLTVDNTLTNLLTARKSLFVTCDWHLNLNGECPSICISNEN